MRFLTILISFALLAACTPTKKSDNATVNFAVPTAAQFASATPESMEKLSSSSTSISSSDMVAANACFMFDVSASDIASTGGNGSCDLPTGVFFGSVAPAGSTSAKSTGVQLTVPYGEQRKFRVFTYFRHSSSEACPSGNSLSDFDNARLSLIGTTDNVSIQQDSVNVDISVKFPKQTIASQFNLPAACSTTVIASTGPNGAASVSGAAVQVLTPVNGYTVSSSVGRSTDQNQMVTSGGFKVYRKRGVVQ